MKSIKRYIMLNPIIFLTLFFVISLTVNYLSLTEISKSKIIEENLKDLNSGKKLIEAWVDSAKKENYILSLSSEVKSGEWDYMKNYLVSVANNSENKYAFIMWIDPEGNYYGTHGFNGYIGDRSYFTEAKSGVYNIVSEVINSRSMQKPVFVVSNPVYDGNKLTGIISSVIYSDTLFGKAEEVSLSNSIFSSVINSEGTIISSKNKNFILNVNLKDTSLNYKNLDKELENLSKYDLGTAKIISPENNRLYLFYVKIDGTPGWALLNFLPYSVFTDSSNKIFIISFSVSLIFIIIFSFYLYFTGKKINKNIEILSEDIKIFSGNNYNMQTLPDTNIKEFQAINKNYLKMTEEIYSNIEEINVMNEDLENTITENKILIQKIYDLTNIFPEIISLQNNDDFLKKFFNIIYNFISECDRGFVISKKNKSLKFIDSRGYDIHEISSADLNYNDFPEVSKVTLIPYEKNAFFSVFEHTEEFMIIPISSDKNNYGYIYLDIKMMKNKKFSQESVNFAEYFNKIIKVFLSLNEFNSEESSIHKSIIISAIRNMDANDNYENQHSENVANICLKISKILNFSEEKTNRLYWAALIHDFGKLFIDRSIINKPTRLTPDEYEIVKTHSEIAYNILYENESLRNIALFVKYHHERYDGKGYPEGLSGLDIPLESRIIAVADSWDSMIQNKPYKRKMTEEEALGEMINNSGRQFDPFLIQIFKNNISYIIKK